jgi:uncharacterized protein YbaP (TraB family)
MRRLVAIAAFAAAVIAPVAADQVSSGVADYATLPTHKALATTPIDASVRGVAFGEGNDEIASANAFARCTAAARGHPCEISRVDDAAVATAESMRAKVPRAAHPLFLWKFESKTATAYLAGSVHVMKPTLYPLPSQFDAAFAKADRLAIEVDTDAISPDALRDKLRSYALLPTGESLATVLKPDALASVDAYLKSQSASIDAFAALKPAILATQLAVARLSALGYMPQFGLEEHFKSERAGRPVLELETIDEQFAVLTSPPMAVQEEMLVETIDQMSTIEPIVTGMIVAWLSGDEREFRRLFDLENGDSPDIRAFSRKLIEDRNVGMADKVAGYLTNLGGTTFVLVGSAHLTGPEGVVALLEARGFHGRHINSNDTI